MQDPAWSNESDWPSLRRVQAGLVGDVSIETVTGFCERPPVRSRVKAGSPTDGLLGTEKSTTWACWGTSTTCCTGLAAARALRLADWVASIRPQAPACRNVTVEPSIVHAWWVVEESIENVMEPPEPPDAFSS